MFATTLMSLTRVKVSWEVFLACTTHAMSTENEEIMGLLLGDWTCNERGEHVEATASDLLILTRSDRRKDRVEISPEQLSEAAGEAERVQARTGKPTRVIGWYHSHPHITVWPSHVDIQTQAQMQMLDPGFIGLIFSVFSEDGRDQTGRARVTAFQSVPPTVEGNTTAPFAFNSQWSHKKVPLTLFSVTSSALDTACEYECPLSVAYDRLVQLQRILFEEEQATFLKNTRDQDNPITSVALAYHGGVYQRTLCQLLNSSTLPVFQQIQERLGVLAHESARLKAENARLRSALSS